MTHLSLSPHSDTPSQPRHRLPRAAQYLALIGCVQLLLGCAGQPLDRYAPASADQPWQPSAESPWASPADEKSTKTKPLRLDFRIPELPNQLPPLEPVAPDARYQTAQPLSLAQLIDIAQQQNSETKQAWNRAREAALNVGLTEAVMLPMISASVLTGYQRRSSPVDLPFDLGSTRVRSNVSSTIPSLTLNWLLFDFGQRAAVRDGAQYGALAANILFNASHQKVIRDVTSSYYSYSAARTRVDLARNSLANNLKVLDAVQARVENGVATRVDLAFAQQAVAQGKLHLVNSEGMARNTYLLLINTLGLPPNSEVPIEQPPITELPTASDPITEERLQAVLNQRADIAAAYSAVRAAEAAERAADAAYMPKVFVAASLAHARSRLNVGSLPTLNPQGTSTGIVLGVSLPLFDGGLRAYQLEKSRVLKDQTKETLHHLRNLALQEVASADVLLNTALQAHDATTELVHTASVAYDAALESYIHGIVSITLATEAATQLNMAYEAQLDARYASLTTAANLAFVMGEMVSAQEQWLSNQP